MEEDRKKDLYIPLPVTDSKDYITGFGQRELGYLIVTLVAALIVAGIVEVVFGSIGVTALVGFSFIGCGVMIVRKDQWDESMIDKLKLILEYQKIQKKYEYQYHDWLSPGKTVWDEEEE